MGSFRRRGSRVAGASAIARFQKERRRNLLCAWRDWASLVLIALGSLAALLLTRGVPQLTAAAVLGFALAVACVGWLIGGSAHALSWMWGAVGEQQTADVLKQLGDSWSYVHDVSRSRGNWDHILVGPPGVFMLESKSYSRPSYVSGDALHRGRIRTEGRMIRGAAIELKEAIGRRDSHPPYVHAVVVIWGEFSQRHHEENSVAYVHGAELVDWLRRHPPKLSAERLAAVRAAVQELAAHANASPESRTAGLQPSG